MRILGNHGVDVAVNGRRERQEDSYSRTIHFTCRTIVDTTAPYELVVEDARQLLGHRPAACPRRPGARFAAGRLRHRHASGRSVHRRPGGARRHHGNRRRLYQRDGAEGRPDRRALYLPEGFGRRDACDDDGGDPCPRHDRDRQRRPRAGSGRSRQLPERHGRQDFRRRHDAPITIEGVTSLSGARHRVLPDRIETGTYAMAVAMAGGDVVLENTDASLLETALETLRRAGADITADRQRHARSCATAAASSRSISSPIPSRASRPTCRRSSWR